MISAVALRCLCLGEYWLDEQNTISLERHFFLLTVNGWDLMAKEKASMLEVNNENEIKIEGSARNSQSGDLDPWKK